MQDLRYNTLATGNDLEMLGDSNFCCKNKMEVGPPLILLSLCLGAVCCCHYAMVVQNYTVHDSGGPHNYIT